MAQLAYHGVHYPLLCKHAWTGRICEQPTIAFLTLWARTNLFHGHACLPSSFASAAYALPLLGSLALQVSLCLPARLMGIAISCRYLLSWGTSGPDIQVWACIHVSLPACGRKGFEPPPTTPFFTVLGMLALCALWWPADHK